MSNLSQFFSGGTTIKSIQRGTITLTSGNTSATATVTAVDTTKAELQMLGANGSSNSSLNDEQICRIALTNSTTITATSHAAASNDVRVAWELTEWN